MQHFAFHALFPEMFTLPSGILPVVEHLEGSAALILAICDASPTPRATLTTIHTLDRGLVDLAELYTRRIFPQTPRLRHAYIRLRALIDPGWIEILGTSCPELEYLALHDPKWFGDKVCPSLDQFSEVLDAGS